MRHTTAFAALLTAAVVSALGIAPAAAQARIGPSAVHGWRDGPVASPSRPSIRTTPAPHPHTRPDLESHPDSHRSPDSVRYAAIKGCAVKGGGQRPCGDWRLVMHSGAQRRLPDAQTLARDAKGKPAADVAAPVAVSGNGQRLAYFSKTGRLAVRTLGGGVRLLAKDALPRVAQYDVTLLLSDDGARLAAFIDRDRSRQTRVFDTETGALLGRIPAGRLLKGFSGDGGEVLTGVDTHERVYDLVVHSDTGEELVRTSPPQVVSVNGPQALSADGRTVAVLVRGDKPQLVLYDMETDQVTARTSVKPLAGELEMLDWTGEAQVTAHLIQYRENKPSKITIVQIDTGTGKATVRDRYTLLKDTFAVAVCGG